MRIELSRDQYRDLLLTVIIGTYIREAVAEMHEEDMDKINALQTFMLSQASNFSSDDMVENFEGVLIPSEKVCEQYHDDIIEEYNNEEFWHRLETDLGHRDFWKTVSNEEHRQIEKDEWLPDRVHKFYEKYEQEFETNGIKNLKIVRGNFISRLFAKWL